MRSFEILTAAILTASTLLSEERFVETFDDADGPYRTLGDAETGGGALRIGGVAAAGSIWFEETFDPEDAVSLHFVYRLDRGDAKLPEGGPGGGLQALIYFGDSAPSATSDGEGGLGTGALDDSVGFAIDLGADANGPDAPHLELNAGSDPSNEVSLVTSDEFPSFLLDPESTASTLRVTMRIDGADVDVAVFSELGPYRGRRVFHQTLDEAPRGTIRLGLSASTGATPIRHEVLEVRAYSTPRDGYFLRGDCNQDGNVCGDVTDMIAIVLRCFQGGPEFPCHDACDANDDGQVCGSVSDVIFLANYCFLGTPIPPARPTLECGSDPTSDELSCEEPRACDVFGGSSESIELGVNRDGFPEILRLRDEMVMIELPAGSFEQGDHFLDFGEDEVE
ncbi:MAG: hypothetical protein AAF517_27170, partial [Planctomycetota bacterium]